MMLTVALYGQQATSPLGDIGHRAYRTGQLSDADQQTLEVIYDTSCLGRLSGLSLMRQYPCSRTYTFLCENFFYIDDTEEKNLSRKYTIYNIVYNMHSSHQKEVAKCLLENLGSRELNDEELLIVHFVINKGHHSKEAYHQVLKDFESQASPHQLRVLSRLRKVGAEWLWDYDDRF
jgi:hypothetical protein